MANMRLGAAGEKLIKSFEELRTTPYRDVGGVVTVGWGHTARAGGYVPRMNVAISEAQAEEIFQSDIAGCVASANELIKVDLNRNQFDAIISWDFNTGALAKSTLLKLLNAGNLAAIPSELMKWNKATVDGELQEVAGLTRRRKEEGALFLTPVAEEKDHPPIEASAQTKPVPPKPKGMVKSKTGGASIVLGTGSVIGAATQLGPVLDGVNAAADAVTKTAGQAHDTVDHVTKAGDAVSVTVNSAAQAAQHFHMVDLSHSTAFLICLGVLAISAFIWWDRWRRMQTETE
jgi:lysozyme